jgi:hypothetical protein
MGDREFRSESRELRFAYLDSSTSRMAYLQTHRTWLEGVLGCELSQALVFAIEPPITRFAVAELLRGVPLYRSDVDGEASPRWLGAGLHWVDADEDGAPPPSMFSRLIQDRQAYVGNMAPSESFITRWAIPPAANAVVSLEPARDRRAPKGEEERYWHAEWESPGVAVWWKGLQHATVALPIPHVEAITGFVEVVKTWVLVNPQERVAALERLRRLFVSSRKVVRVLGGRDIELRRTGYNWDSVVLSPVIRQMLRDDFERFLKDEAWFHRRGLPWRRGFLLYGPPGNGKTMAIRVMASHPDVRAYALDFANRNLSADSVALLFELAARTAPSIVIFEDLDRLYGRNRAVREDFDHDNRTKITLQSLLNTLDGVGDSDGIVVVATANDIAALDRGLTNRPGRFDRQLYFGSPDHDARRDYLGRLDVGGHLGPDDLGGPAAECEGFSFAQIREAYRVASGLALDRGGDEEHPSAEDLKDAMRHVRKEILHVTTAGRRNVGFEKSASSARRRAATSADST